MYGSIEVKSPGDVDTMLSEMFDKSSIISDKAGTASIWNYSLQARRELVSDWGKTVDRDRLANRVTALYMEIQECRAKIAQIDNKKALRVMQSRNVIGMTTTACATRWDLLKSLQFNILVCEEAAEVMEAHTLCTLLPSLQHAIFIGDPLQLRPEINQQMLTLETNIGCHYRLDESLIERLMLPLDHNLLAVPATKLNIQRRMHPEISKIARLIYPYLLDHDSTSQHPVVYGLASRTFWWDHRLPELEADDLKSHVNLFEVEMVAGLVLYLLGSGAYAQGEIAVLTPYSGQLSKLHQRLSSTCDIWLSDKDRDLLLSDDLLVHGIEDRATKDKVTISDMLRLATVDNFQGEEARIIILSTVRSGNSAGFLKSTNRINVACSRARDGFFIIGNSQTLSQVPMWRRIVELFSGRIGPSIMTRCNTHPQHHTVVEQPPSFDKVEPCPSVCGQTLSCGHKCQETCHPPNLHTRLVCREACRTRFECGHKCPKMCYQDCGTCKRTTKETILDCGHPGQKLCSGEETECTVILDSRLFDCGHTVDILCGSNEELQLACQQTCDQYLRCGHICPGKCIECCSKKQHKRCVQICGWLKSCGHHCKSLCHVGSPCPKSCSEPCTKGCEHGSCKRRCSDDCDPCVKTPIAGCEHESRQDDDQNSTAICCLPNLTVTCTEGCDKGKSTRSEPFDLRHN